jgi:hypothetical protein
MRPAIKQPPPMPGLAHISDVLASLDLPDDERELIAQAVEHFRGEQAHQDCSCIRCHRALGTVP